MRSSAPPSPAWCCVRSASRKRAWRGCVPTSTASPWASCSYHRGWVYHGLIVGPLRDAALLLDRLMTGALLPTDLLAQMRDAHPLDVSGQHQGHQERPWRAPAYGLGLMCGVTSHGMRACGHTGGGPGSVIAVYRLPEAAPPYTAAAFAFGERPGAGRGKSAEPGLGLNPCHGRSLLRDRPAPPPHG